MPPVSDLLLTRLPPLTLVITMQLHYSHVYVGAALTPPEGEADWRAEQIDYMVHRHPVSKSELRTLVQRFREVNVGLEKELATTSESDGRLAENSQRVLDVIETRLAQPLVEHFKAHFWREPVSRDPGDAEPAGATGGAGKGKARADAGEEKRELPQRIVLLPGTLFWNMPLERFPSMLQLFPCPPPPPPEKGAAVVQRDPAQPRSAHAMFSRDHSLHLLAQRARGPDAIAATGATSAGGGAAAAGAATGASMVVKAQMACLPLDKTTLLSDPFAEDALSADDPPNSETLCDQHHRLTLSRVANVALRTHGLKYVASPQDIKCMLAASSIFLSVGFGRFFTTMAPKHFMSQDLRGLSVLGLFDRCINNAAFRRQAKMDSQITARQLSIESAYSASLIAASRGVACTVQSIVATPVALAMRSFEVFAKGLQEGKTLAKAHEDMLNKDVDSRCRRYLMAEPGTETAPVASKGAEPLLKVPVVHEQRAPSRGMPQPHSQDVFYIFAGLPWLCQEQVETKKGK
eukprot:NODE_5703_length_1742_cov_10.684830.p1 GENE.NODE_5703_length_1742_cov_10.684830~~NODE_5703_length_1742_cov_10.684830.p1  ORF type:complete len:519 (+),score=157.26 NODE_5703_length_1742_cov_10.684830:3-1559(+)